MKPKDKRIIDTINTGNEIISTIVLAMHEQATEHSNQYKDMLKNNIKECEEAIYELMNIINYYEMELVPYGKIRRIPEKYHSVVYRAVNNTTESDISESY